MTKFILKSLLLSTITILLSCRGERWDDKLTLPKQNYNGNELRIDGYFYNITESNNYEILFLYRNGTVLHGSYASFSELNGLEQSYIDGTYYNIIKNDKPSWGRFIIEGNVISREFWQPSSGGPLDTYTHSGVILNDTTFHITQSWKSHKPKKKNNLDRIYHFKQFSPKPDSTNAYTN